MIITLKGTNPDIGLIESHINKSINHDSRFTVHTQFLSPRRMKLYDVRLKEKKRYCGNHPNSCEVEGGRMGKYLEGLDWVEFNDRINDVLDNLHVSARVYTAVCELRRGFERRHNYDSHIINEWRGLYEWDKKGEDSDYEDYCGRFAPDSTYPFGTPGEYEPRKDTVNG